MTDRPEPRTNTPARGTLGEYLPWGLAALSLGAAAIHFSMTSAHFESYWLYGIFFAATGWFQFAWAVAVLKRPSRGVLTVGIVVNAIVVMTWVLSRTVGVFVGPHADTTEAIELSDLLATSAEALIIVGAAALMSPAVAAKRIRSAAMLPIVGAVGAGVIILSTLSLTPNFMDSHSHGGTESADGSHAHGDEAAAGESADGHGTESHGTEGHANGSGATTVALEDRCDLEINTASFYRDAELAGLDPLGTGGSSHEHESSTAGDVNNPMAHDEGKSAAQIIALERGTDADYDEWLSNLDPNRAGTAPDDTMAGGHSGPNVWTPMTDQAECDQLTADIELARETALSYPTPTEALAGGYTMVTGYVPGIAAHYMNFSYVDEEFEVDKPEMLLYDGTGPDAHMVGLSYYILKKSDAEPTVGFGGNNDHYHRHVGLCVKGAVVIGGSSTTDEDCTARGGTKADGGAGWMSHAWVIPGCESPWGMFSGENPKLDGATGDASGQGEPCASATRDYDDTPGPSDEQVETAQGTDDDEEAAGD